MAAKEKRSMKVPTGAILSKYLRALAVEIETTNADGDLVTKAAALADLVWKYALGGHKERDDKGVEKTMPPAVWAIELLYNRIEGKIPLAVVEEQGRSLTERVSDLGKARINSLAKAAVDPADAPPEEDAE
jgi:hypothetical protein